MSDEWQLVVVGAWDNEAPLAKENAELLAAFARKTGFCSNPVEFIGYVGEEVEKEERNKLKQDLIDGLAKAARQMKECTISKLMVYFAGHGISDFHQKYVTISPELGIMLEGEVMRAVEHEKLEDVCAIVPFLLS